MSVNGGVATAPLIFDSPLKPEDQKDLKWYLEIYAAHYTTDVDDERAERIAEKLPNWGAALFEAVFQNNRHALRLFERFLDAAEPGRLLTVSSSHPAILAQPWELLRDPSGTYLFHENPRISIRRRLAERPGRDERFYKPALKIAYGCCLSSAGLWRAIHRSPRRCPSGLGCAG